jgi:hypothetical protein
MARYFFRADYRNSSVNDDVGEEFSTLQGAEAHATIVANELVRNSTEAVTVAVLSEDGILLAKAPATFLIGFPRDVRPAHRLRHGGESSFGAATWRGNAADAVPAAVRRREWPAKSPAASGNLR